MAIALLQKIDMSSVFAGHFKTLVDYRTGKTSKADLILFYVIPILLGGGFSYTGVRFTDDAIGITMTALAILAGLLFNLLILLHGLSTSDAHPRRERVLKLARQVNSNIAYGVVVSLVAMVTLVVAANLDDNHAYRAWSEGASMIIVAHFVLTMIMVLRRMHVMLQDNLDTQSTRAD